MPQKDRRQRYDSTADLARDLVNLRERASSVSSSIPVVAPVRPGRLGRAALWACGLGCLLGTVAAAFFLSGAWRQGSVGDAASQPPLKMGIAGPGPTGTSYAVSPGRLHCRAVTRRPANGSGRRRPTVSPSDGLVHADGAPRTEGAVSPSGRPITATSPFSLRVSSNGSMSEAVPGRTLPMPSRMAESRGARAERFCSQA